MKKLIIYILITIPFIVTGCKKQKVEDSDEISAKELTEAHDEALIEITRKQFKDENLSWAIPEKRNFPTLIRATGTVDVPPANKAVISAYLGGYVKKAPLLIGDQVKKGDLLLSIENMEFLQLQQQFLETGEQLKFLESEYQRQETLYKEQIASKKSYLQAESTYKRNLATYNGLKQKLELLNFDPEKILEGELSAVSNIYAPISGDITQIEVHTGSYIAPSDPVMEIVDTHHVHLELDIFEKDIATVIKGQEVWFAIPEVSDKTFKGEIYLIGKSITEKRTVKVHVHIDEEDQFLPGMFVQARILTDETQHWALPEQSLIESGGQTFVLMKKNEKEELLILEKIEVISGKSFNDYFEVLNDQKIDSAAQFVVGGNRLVKESGGGHSH